LRGVDGVEGVMKGKREIRGKEKRKSVEKEKKVRYAIEFTKTLQYS